MTPEIQLAEEKDQLESLAQLFLDIRQQHPEVFENHERLVDND